MAFDPSVRFPAFIFTNDEHGGHREVQQIGLDGIAPNGVLIEVEYSSVNYKDGLAATATGKVARISPIIPGIDLAGRVVDPAGSSFREGDPVIAHCYDIGVSEHGGYAQFCRVPAEHIIPMPSGLTSREAMIIGTGGFTAALSIMTLEDWGLKPDQGPVLVTGATGGVGSMAVTMLAGRGYHVVASSGKKEQEAYLRGLGAKDVIDRSVLSDDDPRPLQSMEYAGAVDCVGGSTLANLLKRLKYGSAVAASGLTGGANFTSTVMPFILRAVALLGIDAALAPMDVRTRAWQRIGADLKPAGLDTIGHDIDLNDLDRVLTTILQGGLTGRYVVRPTA
jgi:putative YhdH/YhfP family quinone oxidoreductase